MRLEDGEVHLEAELDTQADASKLFEWVADLAHYPQWLGIVARAVPLDDNGRPAWQVDLRASLGPLARSKRLRMLRTVHAPHTEVVFERQETDGREHGRWRLAAAVQEIPSGSRLHMDLDYDGRFAGAVIERLLRDEVERCKPRLLELLDGPPAD